MKAFRMGLAVMMTVVMSVAAQAGDDVQALKKEIEELRNQVTASEAARFAPAGGDAETLTSMRKTGAIKIGGEAQVWYTFMDTETGTRNVTNGDYSVSDSFTSALDGELELEIDVKISENVKLTTQFDFNVDSDAADDPLEELLFHFSDIFGMPLKLTFGQFRDLDFGIDHARNVVGNPFGVGNAVVNLIEDQPEEAMGVDLTFEFGDMGEIGFTLFENDDDGNSDLGALGQAADSTAGGIAQHESRPDDSLFFQSWLIHSQLNPVEGLELSLDFINIHNNSMGDEDFRTANSNTFRSNGEETDSIQAITGGVVYAFSGMPLEVGAYYTHQWDAEFNDEIDTDVVGVDVSYGLTDSIDIYGEFDYGWIDGGRSYDGSDADVLTDDIDGDEEAYVITLGVAYMLPCNIEFDLYYQYWHYEQDSKDPGNGAIDYDDEELDANSVTLEVNYEF